MIGVIPRSEATRDLLSTPRTMIDAVLLSTINWINIETAGNCLKMHG